MGGRERQRTPGRCRVKGLIGILRTLATWALLAAASALVVVGLQWQAPERSVVPIGEKFICDGRLAVGGTEGPDATIVREVTCVHGRSSDDITLLTLVLLGVPTVLVLATAALLFRRFLAPRQRVVRRAVGAT